MQYALRTNIHLATWRSFLPELIRVCHEAHIDEVLLSEESFEIATVLQSREYFHRIADAYCEIVPLLRAEGIVPSFYIKVSMGHYEANLAPEKVLPFTKFVGQDLTEAPTTPCGMDESWQEYLCQIGADCARAGFERMYLDDDFRSVNHNQGRTGCFCRLHVQATQQRCGLPLTAKSLLDHLGGNSEEDRRVRNAWMDVNYESQLAFGRKLERAVHAVSPRTQLGLMCCGDHGSCLQGRDLPELLRVFAGEGNRPIARPAGGAYADTLLSGVNDMYLGTARYLANSDKNLFAVSEVDSYPRTVMSKSARQTDLHLQLHALTGCQQATLNLFDHFETPFSYCQEYVDLLKNRRALYDRVQALKQGRTPRGVCVPWKWSVSRTIENRAGSVRGLYPYSTLTDPSGVLARCGLPLGFGDDRVAFLDGDMVDAMSREEIAGWLEKAVFVDKFAAKRLCERGFGQEIGLSNPNYYEDGCYECFDVADYAGGYDGQYVAAYGRNVQDERNKPLLFDAAPGAFAVSHLLDLDKRPFAGATWLYENARGGRVCVFAAAIVPDRNWLYKPRAAQVRAILKWLLRGGETFAASPYNVMPIVLEGEEDWIVALVNSSLDDQAVSLDTPRGLTDALTGEPVGQPVELPAMSIRYLRAQKTR